MKLSFRSIGDAHSAFKLPVKEVSRYKTYESEFHSGGYPEVLIVNRVLPWSTSIRSGIEEGDIVWGINGHFIGNNLLRMSRILDDSVDKRIEVDV